MPSLWQTIRNHSEESEIDRSSALAVDKKKKGGLKIARS
jgi:hypothetical protein